MRRLQCTRRGHNPVITFGLFPLSEAFRHFFSIPVCVFRPSPHSPTDSQSSAALHGEPVDEASAAFLHSLVSNTGAGAALLVKLARFAPDRQVVQSRVRALADEAARLWLAVLLKHLGRTALAMADAEAPAEAPAQRQLVEAWKKVGFTLCCEICISCVYDNVTVFIYP